MAALAFASLSVAAQAADITVGYQTGIDPTKVPQADGLYEKAIGEKIDWRRFNSGPEVIAALASGDLQLGNIGSSPLAAATSRKLPIVAFIVSAQINAAEALVVRNGSGIGKPEDLAGKTIATPFVSTSHYSLLGALKHWQIDPSKVKIVNLNPAEIAAAWRRGDIDGPSSGRRRWARSRKAARSSPTPPKSASGCADLRGVGGAQGLRREAS